MTRVLLPGRIAVRKRVEPGEDCLGRGGALERGGGDLERVPGRLDWDAKANRFTNSDAANKLLTPYVRPTWTIG